MSRKETVRPGLLKAALAGRIAHDDLGMLRALPSDERGYPMMERR